MAGLHLGGCHALPRCSIGPVPARAPAPGLGSRWGETGGIWFCLNGVRRAHCFVSQRKLLRAHNEG